jgi:DNA-binding transcriptional ArsR family regulator
MTVVSATGLLEDPAVLQVVSHPVRIRVLAALSAPASAAAVARAIGESRQNTNYHLKELERVGVVIRTGERRVGNFVETLYRATARTLLVSPRLILGGPQRARALADQLSLEQLVSLSERLALDAVTLLDCAAFDGQTIPSASVEVEVQLGDEGDRQAFLNDYLAAVAALTRKYGRRGGETYRVALAAYPLPKSIATDAYIQEEPRDE